VFIAQFFNTGILPMLVMADLREQSKFLGKFFSGTDNDYNEHWFHTTGNTIMGAMMINSIMPIVSIMITIGVRQAKILLDRGLKDFFNENKTKK